MNIRWQRFINQRTLLIVSIMLLIAFFLQLREGRFGGDREHPVYEQQRLIVDAGCDITRSGCSSSGDGVRVLLTLKDRPSALRPFPAHVLVEGLLEPQQMDVRLVFSMQGMDMGDLRQRLVFDPDNGDWHGQMILPICTSGRSDWLARVEVTAAKKIYSADYAFVLNK